MLLLLTVSYYDIHLNRFKYDGIWLCEKESIKQTNKQTEEKRIKKSLFFRNSLLWKGKISHNIIQQHGKQENKQKNYPI